MSNGKTTKEQVLDILKEEIQIMPSGIIRDVVGCVVEKLIFQIETEVEESQVRKLVWVNNSAIAFKYGTEHPIRYDIDKYGKTVFLKFNNNIITNTDSIKRAKGHAQEHFERLIRGCIV